MTWSCATFMFWCNVKWKANKETYVDQILGKKNLNMM
jgi:hypothetical protein